MILALAAEANDEFVWDRVRTLQREMFAAGPIQVKFAYFGREGALQVRPYITTSWVAALTIWPTSWTAAGPAACAAVMFR